MVEDLVDLTGWERPAPAGFVVSGRADRSLIVPVSVYLVPPAAVADQLGWRRRLVAYAHSCGVSESAGPGAEVVVLTGEVAAVERCFGTRLSMWVGPAGQSCLRPDSPPRLPRDLQPHVVAVLGLDTAPAARPR